MSSKELELDFQFNNEELANFLENFSQKIREGEVGLSFKGKEEINIEPNQKSHIELEYDQSSEHKKLELEIKLRQEIDRSEGEGREKITVEIV